MPEICVERPSLISRFSADSGLFGRDRITVLDNAVGDDVERIYMMLLVPELRERLAHQLGHAMAEA